MIVGSGRCHYHPDRSGVGVCVECRHVICRECTTPVDGINRCAACLAKKLAARRTERPRREWGVGSIFLSIVAFGVVFGAVALLGTLLSR